MSDALRRRFDAQGAEWRDPLQIVGQWAGAAPAGDELAARASGEWWERLARDRVTLIVSREYEHLLLAIGAETRPRLTYLRLPHPSGVAFDAAAGRLFVASTRNPNQLYELRPVAGLLDRADLEAPPPAAARPLVPARTWYLPGCSYLHDLALVGGRLHANAVGQNAVVAIEDGAARPVWWPLSVDRGGAPRSDRNYLQLNSIAAGPDLAASFFSASGERPGRYRPGDPRYPVDRRGVVYSGRTREPVVRGLTRPHSARLHEGRVWVANSGYGELGVGEDGRLRTVARLPGWTRGLAFTADTAYVATSRVIPRFRQYAPGLDVERSRCGIHAVDLRTGRIAGSLWFPAGNQIFAIEPVPSAWTSGFPFHRRARPAALRSLFYAYDLGRQAGGAAGGERPEP
jgi:uncharacterized protein (TIGR03032 family)